MIYKIIARHWPSPQHLVFPHLSDIPVPDEKSWPFFLFPWKLWSILVLFLFVYKIWRTWQQLPTAFNLIKLLVKVNLKALLLCCSMWTRPRFWDKKIITVLIHFLTSVTFHSLPPIGNITLPPSLKICSIWTYVILVSCFYFIKPHLLYRRIFTSTIPDLRNPISLL